jgi:hypothetical protein
VLNIITVNIDVGEWLLDNYKGIKVSVLDGDFLC